MFKSVSTAEESKTKYIKIHINDKEFETLSLQVAKNTNFTNLLESLQEKLNLDIDIAHSSFHTYKSLQELKNEKKKIAIKNSDSVSKYLNSSNAPLSPRNTEIISLEIWLNPSLPYLENVKVFGMSLNRLCTRGKVQNRKSIKSINSIKATQDCHIPEVLDLCFNYLNDNDFVKYTEGIFRISGSIREPTVDPHIVTGLIKLFLRELPEPVMTYSNYDKIIELFTPTQEPKEKWVGEMRTLIHQLPKENYIVLEALMALLNKVYVFEEVTKMGLQNLSIIFGVILIAKDPKLNAQKTPMDLLGSATETPVLCRCCSTMIQYYSQLFDNDSPFDSNLVGMKKIPQDQLLQWNGNTNAISIPTQQQTASFMEQGTPPKKAREVFEGYLPRTMYDRTKENCTDISYSPYCVRVTGESISCLIDLEGGEDLSSLDAYLEVEREIPFDNISDIRLIDETYVHVQYFRNPKENTLCNLYIQFEDAEIALDWKDDLLSALQKFKDFKQLAASNARDYGTIMTRDQLQQIKKAKLTRKMSEVSMFSPISPLSNLSVSVSNDVEQQQPFDQMISSQELEAKEEEAESNGEEQEESVQSELDSDSDDSVDFRI